MPPKAAKSKEAPAERPILGRFSSHLKIGIVGLPNVGKSTLFNTLTKLSIPAENFPFCTIEPNEARVHVPDERFEWLCQLYKPKSEVSAFLEIHDIAGLVRGAHQGQGLGNNFLSHIRAVDGIFHVLRAFEDSDIIHVDDSVDPVRDLEVISSELRLKDLEFMERRIEDLEKSLKRSNDKQLKLEHELCFKGIKDVDMPVNVVTFSARGLPHLRIEMWSKRHWRREKMLASVEWKAADIEILNTFQLLSAKPVVYLVNMNEKDYQRKKNKFLPKIHAWVQEHGGETIIPVSCALERNLADMSPDEAVKYCEENEVQSALTKIIKTGFSAINLIYFFTAGPDEVKCWQIRRQTKAPQAAGTIHTDFEKGFICAEVMKFEDLKELGSEAAVKAAGKYRQEGKTYVVVDGDIIFFKFNVSGGGSLVSGGVAQTFGTVEVLDLSYNQLSGELPGFNFVYDLQVLKLSNNRFSGYIPNNLLKGDSLVLTDLDLSGNNLSGPISMITSTTLNTLNLSSNVLSGELPLLTGSCAVVDLSSNQLEGNLSRLLKWGNIEILDLSHNHLVGSIPEVTAQFLRLKYLNLSHNSLNGSLPRAILQFPKLTTLDFSFNQLDGPLLPALLTSVTLKELHLQSNTLSGSIGFSPPSGDSNLRVLDISDNRFDGYFPDEFGNFSSIEVLNVGGNNLSGSLPTSIGGLSILKSLDISRNHFTGPIPNNFPNTLQSFNASYNDLSGVVPENLRKFSLSSFYPGNSQLQFPNPPPSSGHVPDGNTSKKHLRTAIKVAVIAACVIAIIFFVLLALFIYYKCSSKRLLPHATDKDGRYQTSTNTSSVGGGVRAGGLVVSAEDLVTSRKGSSLDIISPDENIAAVTGFSPSKPSQFSWSPESGDSFTAENLSRLDVRSPEQLAGELYFLDDTVSFSAGELSRAPAEVLGRSSHGTSYRATMENGLFLTVKWLREGVAKQKKDFAKEAKKFANIKHPNVVGLRGYYWGPTQHEKLILSDTYLQEVLLVFSMKILSCQSISFTSYVDVIKMSAFSNDISFFRGIKLTVDRPGRKGPPLTWAQRLKIAVDVARGLNYLHFDRAIPHGNLKATNILLDGPDLNARVADYCLHRLMTQSGIIEQILDAGVLGYRAPELAALKKPQPSFKSDIYAFGVILLELLTGKCAGDVVSGEDGGVDLTDWVRLRVAEGRGSDCFDSVLTSEMAIPAVDKGMKKVLEIALRCIRAVTERPGIKTIYEDLSSI
ncbi:putative LRR receptor-like serine/threonine-protein kinase [Dorcoceras hygrometricum]|uniref:Obg-like ATPase 1 n=1 Tax=Dorcoceras hygrometricum TaxID=472368 RepID=A0A2Z7BY19_9LAMI|nr:putative LRR receptor-like serine/threonine-protein kinase [Dorcoceras hygrometricum]